MSTAAPAQPTMLADYQLHLPGYEGPFDVLLRLIERNQLEITDVSLVAVTAQFLEHVAGMTAALDTIASFTTVGTRLALLKSRSLLPRPETIDEEDGPSELTRQLLEYRLARDASTFLAARYTEDLRSYARVAPAPGDPDLRRASERLATYPVSVLATALRRRLTVVPRPLTFVPARKAVSLRETVSRLLELTRLRRRVPFSDVVSAYRSRTEVATAFLGLLVLVRRHMVVAHQSGLFGEIEVERTANVDDAGEIDEQFDSE